MLSTFTINLYLPTSYKGVSTTANDGLTIKVKYWCITVYCVIKVVTSKSKETALPAPTVTYILSPLDTFSEWMLFLTKSSGRLWHLVIFAPLNIILLKAEKLLNT